MQRKPTKQSPSIDASAKRHLKWLKERGICCACGNDGGVNAHHSAGSSAKVHVGLARVMIGHWFILGLCQPCDNLATRSRARFRQAFGRECDLWLKQAEHYPEEIPLLIIQGICAWGK